MVDVKARLTRTAQWLRHEFRQAPGEEGWGQFVERDAGDPLQIGWYGTSAGIGVLTLADEIAPAGAFTWLLQAWDQRGADKQSAAHASQTARVAIALLGLAGSTDPRVAGLKQSFVQALLGRRLANGTWGEWYVSDVQRSAWTSPDMSALALIALAAQSPGLVPAHELARSAEALMRHVGGIEGRDPEALLLPLAAVAMAVPPNKQSRKTRGLIRRALKYRPHPDDTYVVMFNYGYIFQGTERYGRDYILMPKLFPYLLLSAHRGGVFGVVTAAHGIATASSVIANGTDYLFGRGRLSATLDQFLVAFALAACDRVAGSTSRIFASGAAWLVQDENGVTRLAMPAAVLSWAAIAAADPMLFSSIPCPGVCLPDPSPFKGLIRLGGIATMTFVGRPLLDSIWNYIKIKRGTAA